MDRQRITESIVGPVSWKSATEGYCQCPGQAQHTHRTGERHCRVTFDQVPTIYCFHSSCAGAVAEANHRLRSAFGKAERGQECGARPFAPAPAPDPEPGIRKGTAAAAEEHLERILRGYAWPYADICQSSPVGIPPSDARWQFQAWLRLWRGEDVLWIGNVYDSGHPRNAGHFRAARDWAKCLLPAGNYTCGATFRPGSFKRGSETVLARRFMIVESDTLTRDQVGAVFRYLSQVLGYQLHCIIDTAGKSLHGWFSPPHEPQDARMKSALIGWQCDPKTLHPSQPVRVPGAMREDRLQRMIWLA